MSGEYQVSVEVDPVVDVPGNGEVVSEIQLGEVHPVPPPGGSSSQAPAVVNAAPVETEKSETSDEEFDEWATESKELSLGKQLDTLVKRYKNSDIVPGWVCDTVDHLCKVLHRPQVVFVGDIRFGPPVCGP